MSIRLFAIVFFCSLSFLGESQKLVKKQWTYGVGLSPYAFHYGQLADEAYTSHGFSIDGELTVGRWNYSMSLSSSYARRTDGETNEYSSEFIDALKPQRMDKYYFALAYTALYRENGNKLFRLNPTISFDHLGNSLGSGNWGYDTTSNGVLLSNYYRVLNNITAGVSIRFQKLSETERPIQQHKIEVKCKYAVDYFTFDYYETASEGFVSDGRGENAGMIPWGASFNYQYYRLWNDNYGFYIGADFHWYPTMSLPDREMPGFILRGRSSSTFLAGLKVGLTFYEHSFKVKKLISQ
jgi:hypothetical protein